MEKWGIEKLTNENYSIWKIRVEFLLIKEDLWNVVVGGVPDPVTTKWINTDAKARALIGLSIEDNQLIHIRNCKTARECWTSLQSYHERSSLSSKVFLLKRICRMRLEEGGDMEKHIHGMLEQIDKLTAIGGELPSQLTVAFLLCSVPSSYDGLVTALESRGDDELTLDLVKGKLLQEYLRRCEQMESPTSMELVARADNRRYTQGFSRNPKTRDGSVVDSRSKNLNIQCYNCEGYGHKSYQCLERKKKTNSRDGSGKANSYSANNSDTDGPITTNMAFACSSRYSVLRLEDDEVQHPPKPRRNAKGKAVTTSKASGGVADVKSKKKKKKKPPTDDVELRNFVFGNGKSKSRGGGGSHRGSNAPRNANSKEWQKKDNDFWHFQQRGKQAPKPPNIKPVGCNWKLKMRSIKEELEVMKETSKKAQARLQDEVATLNRRIQFLEENLDTSEERLKNATHNQEASQAVDKSERIKKALESQLGQDRLTAEEAVKRYKEMSCRVATLEAGLERAEERASVAEAGISRRIQILEESLDTPEERIVVSSRKVGSVEHGLSDTEEKKLEDSFPMDMCEDTIVDKDAESDAKSQSACISDDDGEDHASPNGTGVSQTHGRGRTGKLRPGSRRRPRKIQSTGMESCFTTEVKARPTWIHGSLGTYGRVEEVY